MAGLGTAGHGRARHGKAWATGHTMAQVIPHTKELQRILDLPRRTWDPVDAQDLATQLTTLLRTPHGMQILRPVQAIALYEASRFGAFLPLRVGAGKTLISFLLCYTLDAKRPVLLVPAKLCDKTVRALRLAQRDWRVPNFIRVVSFEILGRTQSADLLDQYCPDLIVADEAHRIKYMRAAVTRRVLRYLGGHRRYPEHATPEDRARTDAINAAGRACRFIPMSGTFMKRSIRDYAHLLTRALHDGQAPVPNEPSELEMWGDAMDERPNTYTTRTEAGALSTIIEPSDGPEPLPALRRAYRRRLVETPGVVATQDGFEGPSLSITAIKPRMGKPTDEAFRTLRSLWELPDGQPLADGVEVWRHARELALGLYYRWRDPAPEAWLLARKEWCSTCRAILVNNRRGLDSEKAVADAVDLGHYSDARMRLERWRGIKDSFKPITVPVWIDHGAIDAAAKWAKEPGIIWTEHRWFATKLAQTTGLSYFGSKGQDATGRTIPEYGEKGSGEGCIVVSRRANGEGRNLQAWSRNLVVSPDSNGDTWEQLIGRTHREGQASDEVSFEVFITCQEDAGALARACSDAECTGDVTGQAQKLMYADLDLPGPEGLR